MKDPEMETAMLSRSRNLAACTREFLETIAALRAQNQNDVETIWNAACHINVLDHDISALLYFDTTTEDIWAQRTVARTLAALIYEACADLQQLLGKRFMDACSVAGIYQEIEVGHKAAKKKLGDFAKQHESMLKKIRHNAGAHRDHDAIEFLTVVADTDPAQMVAVACDFSTILLELAKVCNAAIAKANQAYRAKGVIP